MGTAVVKQNTGLEWDTLGAAFFPSKYGSPSWETLFLKLLEGNCAGLLGLQLFSVITGNSYHPNYSPQVFRSLSTLGVSAMRLLPSRQATTSQLRLQASDQLRSIDTALACGPPAHEDDIDASLEAS